MKRTFLILLLSAAWAHALTPTYSLTQLPTGSPYGINDQGTVLLALESASTSWALYTHGHFSYPAPLVEGANYFVDAMNNFGEVIGSEYNNEQVTGFAYLPTGSFVTIQPISGATAMYPTGINDLGQIVGYFTPAGIPQYTNDHLFLRQPNGGCADLGGFGDAPVALINNQGTMVIVTTIGTATGSYIRQPGSTKLQQIPPLVPGCAMIANEINNFGAVAGIAYLDGIADRNFHAFVYANGKSTDLGTLPPTVPNPGLLSSQAFGINIWGQIVGDSEDRIANFTHGIIYYNGVMHDLNSMLSASTKGWVIVEANSINDLGQILCYASYQNNPSVSVILTPNLILP